MAASCMDRAGAKKRGLNWPGAGLKAELAYLTSTKKV
jgi:hypothetical protein